MNPATDSAAKTRDEIEWVRVAEFTERTERTLNRTQQDWPRTSQTRFVFTASTWRRREITGGSRDSHGLLPLEGVW